MPAPHGRDLELTRKRLTEWFAERLTDASDVSVSELAGPGTTGFSNDTLMFDLGYRRGDRQHRESLVARIEPSGYRVFPEYDLRRQFRVQEMLAGTDVPVARMYWQEDDPGVLGAPFYVMARVEGRIPTDNPPYHAGGWVTEVEPPERAAMWWSGLDVLGRIHRLDWRALGFDFLAMPERGASPLDQQLHYYEEYLTWAARSVPQPTCEPALAWLREHRPREEPVALCWGDARIGNMIFHEGRCAAVLDWEMVTLGNPVQDLAWWLFVDRHHSEGLGIERLPGFPSREETVARWEGAVGLPAEHLDYYEVFAAFRFGVIMIRLAQQLTEYGLLPEDSDFETNNIVTRLLARLLGLPAPGGAA
jgi:aminoglycoside phosphotransferase (APT) family kinase protein